jgi:TonB family protein
MLRLLFLCALLAAPATSPAAPLRSDEGLWEATTPFTIPSSADRCTAFASFQNGSEKLVLGLESRPTSDDYLILIAMSGDLKPTWETSKNYLGGRRLESDFVSVERSKQPGTEVYRIPIARGELVASGNKAELRLDSKLIKIKLLLADLGASLGKLDQCDSNLLSDWGYSADFQSNLASYPRPKMSIGSYASTDDYPASAVRDGAMGDVHALVAVSAKGRGTDCRIVRSVGRRDLDEMTCKILTDRVRFVPAKTKAGEPIDGPFYYAFRWELPKG